VYQELEVSDFADLPIWVLAVELPCSFLSVPLDLDLHVFSTSVNVIDKHGRASLVVLSGYRSALLTSDT